MERKPEGMRVLATARAFAGAGCHVVNNATHSCSTATPTG